MGYPIGVPIWVLEKNTYISRLLTTLLKVNKNKANKQSKISLGFRVKNIMKNE